MTMGILENIHERTVKDTRTTLGQGSCVVLCIYTKSCCFSPIHSYRLIFYKGMEETDGIRTTTNTGY